MPIYNREKYLNRSFNSLFTQTYQNFEIIAIDDFSKDKSLNFVLEKMKFDSRIKSVQHLYNQGTLASRNNGVIESRGEYIMSLDSDDQFFNDAIEKSYKSIREFDADVVEFSFLLKYDSYNKTEKCTNSYNSNTVIFHQLLRFNSHLTNWNVCKKIIKRSVYVNAVMLILPFVDNKWIAIGEDLIQSAVIFALMKNLICSQNLAYIYYRNVDFSIAKKSKALPKSQKIILKDYFQSLIRYLYRYRKDLNNVNFTQFLNESNNLQLYNKIINIDKTISRNCTSDNAYFNSIEYIQKGYCTVMNKKITLYFSRFCDYFYLKISKLIIYIYLNDHIILQKKSFYFID